MRAKTTLSISEARKKIFQIADEVQKPSVYYTLTQNGRPKVVIMSAEEFESWQETMEIMADPELVAEIKQTEKDFEEGRMENFISWEEAKKELGYLLADKPKKSYVSRRPKQRSPERSKKNR